jgi:membrane protein
VTRALQIFWWLLRRSLWTTYENNGLGTAKGAAYSALLAFFPVLASVGTVLVLANAEAVARTIAGFLFEVAPPGTETLLQHQLSERGERPVLVPVSAFVVSIWAASGLMVTLMQGFQAAYHLPTGRSAIHGRAMAILLVFTTVVPAVGASALIVFGATVERSVLLWMGLFPAEARWEGGVKLAGELVRYLIALGAVVLVTSLLYYFGPYRKQRLRDVLPGALLATLLWLIATTLFAWYVRDIADYNLLYGSIGAVIALLIWFYVLSVVALIGCEFNANLEQLRRAFSKRL